MSKTPDLLLHPHRPLLRQRLHDPAIEHRRVSPRKRDLVRQILGQQGNHVAVPIGVQARRVLELRVLVAALRLPGDRELEVERCTQKKHVRAELGSTGFHSAASRKGGGGGGG